MKRLGILIMSSILFLFGKGVINASESSYLKDLKEFLAGREFQATGALLPYDFNKNYTLEYNDWIYISLRSLNIYQLLGNPPTNSNVFGFKKLDIPLNIENVQPAGYFIYINFPRDRDKRFSWLYLERETLNLYKLVGKTENNRFKYLDIDDDGIPDSLIEFLWHEGIEIQLTEGMYRGSFPTEVYLQFFKIDEMSPPYPVETDDSGDVSSLPPSSSSTTTSNCEQCNSSSSSSELAPPPPPAVLPSSLSD